MCPVDGTWWASLGAIIKISKYLCACYEVLTIVGSSIQLTERIDMGVQ